MLIIGDKEQESDAVSVRLRTEEDLGSMSVADVLDRITQEIAART
jgi:threonyl-tRNA synthetase